MPFVKSVVVFHRSVGSEHVAFDFFNSPLQTTPDCRAKPLSDSQKCVPVDKPQIVGLGEALYDCLANREVLGGAPVNLAVHAGALARRLQGQGFPATRVGNDERGKRLLAELKSRGISTDYVQIDPQLPTGTVDVQIGNTGDASYHFADKAAWHAFEFTPPWRQLAESCHAVCFGTLAQHPKTGGQETSGHVASRQAIHQFLETASNATRLFDVNFRQDFFSALVVENSLALATAVKLNEEELPAVTAMLGLDATASPDDQAQRLIEQYELDWLAQTCGSKGTTLYTRGEKHRGEPVQVERQPDADSVGAGDACCAGLLLGALLGWAPDRTLNLANTLGAYVASHAGATPALPDSILAMVTPN